MTQDFGTSRRLLLNKITPVPPRAEGARDVSSWPEPSRRTPHSMSAHEERATPLRICLLLKFRPNPWRGRKSEITARNHRRAPSVSFELLSLPLFGSRIDLFRR